MKFTRASDRYFEGFKRVKVLKANGKGMKTEYVYCGNWYGFPGGKAQGTRMKLITAGLSVLALAAFLYVQITPALVGTSHIVGGLTALSFIPFMFEIAAFCTFIPSKERWIARVMKDGYQNLTLWAKILWVCLAVSFLLQFGFTCYVGDWAQEIRPILVYLFALAAQSVMLWQIRKNPAELLEKGELSGEEETENEDR